MSRGRGRRAPAAALAVGLALAIGAHHGRAHADEESEEAPESPASLPARAATLVVEQKTVRFGVAFRDAFDAEITKKLTSGLPTVVTMRAYLFGDGGGDPLALTAKSCKVVYDLWDEVFRIQVTQAGGSSAVVAVNAEGVLRHCGESKRLPLVERAALKDGSKYFVAVLVEVNPVSADTLDRIKRWVTRPNATTAIGPGDALFGSFVGLFVARVATADKRVAFRTASFAPTAIAVAPSASASSPPAPSAAPPPPPPAREGS